MRSKQKAEKKEFDSGQVKSPCKKGHFKPAKREMVSSQHKENCYYECKKNSHKDSLQGFFLKIQRSFSSFLSNGYKIFDIFDFRFRKV
jgi:hypothetical protein